MSTALTADSNMWTMGARDSRRAQRQNRAAIAHSSTPAIAKPKARVSKREATNIAAREFFQVALVTYLILTIAETLKVGFVSNVFDMNFLLLGILASGTGMVITETDRRRAAKASVPETAYDFKAFDAQHQISVPAVAAPLAPVVPRRPYAQPMAVAPALPKAPAPTSRRMAYVGGEIISRPAARTVRPAQAVPSAPRRAAQPSVMPHRVDSFIPVAPNPAAMIPKPAHKLQPVHSTAVPHGQVIDPVYGRAVTHRPHAPVSHQTVNAARSQLMYASSTGPRRRSLDGFLY